MKSLPLLIVVILLLVGFTLLRRNRQRLAAGGAAAAAKLTPGAEVMTTSGLYGTVVAVDSEAGTATLAIAPGVEVTWALAALRAVADLPSRYRNGSGQRPATPEVGPSNDDGGPHSDDGRTQ